MLEPVDALQDGITTYQGSLERLGMACQLATLLGDTRLQSSVTGRQFEQLGIHSGLLRERRSCAMSASSSDRLALNILLGWLA